MVIGWFQAPISVGWGTKETQFHGKAGKAAAKAAGPTMTPIGQNDDRKVRFVKKFIFPFCLKNEIDCTVKWNVKLFSGELNKLSLKIILHKQLLSYTE
jgi:hypothetical protein